MTRAAHKGPRSPSMNGPKISTSEPRLVIGRATSSSASAHGPCSFSMSANPASRSQRGSSGKPPAETISVMLAVFARIEPTLRKSITFDNDTAFAQHALLKTRRAMTTWFCDAYASWQKGGLKTPTADYDAGCRVRSTLTKCPTRNPGHHLHRQSHAEKMPRFRRHSSDPQRAWQRRPNTVFINPLHLAPESHECR